MSLEIILGIVSVILSFISCILCVIMIYEYRKRWAEKDRQDEQAKDDSYKIKDNGHIDRGTLMQEILETPIDFSLKSINPSWKENDDTGL